MANLASPILASNISASFLPTSVIARKEIGPGPKLVYSRLLTYAANKEPATNNQLAADLAVSPRSIRNYISALKAVGLVQVQLHPGKPRSFTLAAAN